MPTATLDELLTIVTIPRLGPVVYFLFDGETVVYVGQTVSFLSRMQSHIDDGKVFDRVGVIPCELSDLDLVEQHWIKTLRPKYSREIRRKQVKRRGAPAWKTTNCAQIVAELAANDDVTADMEDRPITALGFSRRTTFVLVSNGIETVGELRKIGRDVVTLNGCGSRTMGEVDAALSRLSVVQP